MTNIEPPVRRTCGAMAEHRRLLTDSSQYRRARADLENTTRDFQRLERTTEEVVQIPVVVHVVARVDSENISDDQVTSQIEVLNRDYRAINKDLAAVPEVFAELIGDAKIEFVLATVDPDGNPTSGITRTSTTQMSFGTDNAIKFSDRGGADAWPADRYLNMWVGLLRGGLLGYAQFPGGPMDTDGVVITHTAFGTTGTATEPFNLGRTATHEVGHYLNLFHIWGDDGSGCGGTDEVSDTPNQGSENTGKPTFPKISCNNGPSGDLFMDYMDYVDDDTMVMFTVGQVNRMRTCLETARSSLRAPVPTATG
ncbi:M43 family zinc metalloprotease [Gordonia rubripertincta]|uniref:M43 family zinc metalloprotease n=1 Tax=Gordonia rubripertincta TaxID=36822 RepID=A0ABT4N410_GORRU|nr:M43 family zinc metalloprotease [Gordonia rubripertincta]MCZ4553794.1 M43 family zinc metalloprotease [Gordonia rubripertincta]